MAIAVSPRIRAELFERATAAGSVECCGYLVGPRDAGHVDELVACANAATDRANQFAFGDADLLAFVRSLDSERPARALYHSHPNGRAYLSPTDRAVAATSAGPIYPVDHIVIGGGEAAHFAWSAVASDFVEIARWHATVSPMSEKLDALSAALTDYGRVVVAFSGGVDSAFLLKVAVDALGDRCHAITAVSPTMARSEIDDARALAAELGLGDRHHVVDSHELEVPGFADNPTHRCALCKTELMDIAAPVAARLDAPIALGTNVDDLGDVRPGIAAARDRGARMPMVDAQLTKLEIRALSKQLGLRTWDKPQLACLSSRFPYGTQITPDRLRRVDGFEDALRALGFRQVRVRFHDAIARLELDLGELPRLVEPGVREAVVAAGKKLGFTYIAVDLGGFRSGSLNELLPLGVRKSS